MSYRIRCNEFLIFLLYLSVFQNPLEDLLHPLSYFDESWGFLFIMAACLFHPVIRFSRKYRDWLLIFLTFMAIGLTANALYAYQTAPLVLLDIITNTKFFTSLFAISLFVNADGYEIDKSRISRHVRYISVFLFLLALTDCAVHLLGREDMYAYLSGGGMKLMYSHVTYLTGALVFLTVLLLFFYRKGNGYFIVANSVVILLTMRSKGYGFVAVVFFIWTFIIKNKSFTLKLRHLLMAFSLLLCLAWPKIYLYYVQLSESSARAVMTLTSFKIMKDYFPIGVGFGTYGSNAAAVNYSPVYVKYGFLNYYELGGNPERTGFFSDTFWPIIFGQTGFLGAVAYLILIGAIFKESLKVRHSNRNVYASVLAAIAYLLISSTSEPAFHNSVAIPLTIVLGYAIKMNASSRSAFDVAKGRFERIADIRILKQSGGATPLWEEKN